MPDLSWPLWPLSFIAFPLSQSLIEYANCFLPIYHLVATSNLILLSVNSPPFWSVFVSYNTLIESKHMKVSKHYSVLFFTII